MVRIPIKRAFGIDGVLHNEDAQASAAAVAAMPAKRAKLSSQNEQINQEGKYQLKLNTFYSNYLVMPSCR
jgi:hypothetical protein